MHTPTLVLLTVNDNETDALLDAFRTEGHETRGGLTYTLLGEMAGLRLVHTISEMGSGNVGAAQQRSREAIEHWSPVALVAVGIAFGMDETKQSIGDVLVATQVQDYELGRLNADGTLTPRGDRPHSSDTLINRLRHADTARRRTEPDWPKVRFGCVLSGQKLVDNLDYRDSLRAQFGETIGGEMEAQGVYVSATTARVDWAIVKAICDWGHTKDHPQKDAWQKIAARNAVRLVKAALELGPLYTPLPPTRRDEPTATRALVLGKPVASAPSGPASSFAAVVARYRQAQLSRLPGPMFFSPETRNLSQRERDALFVEPLLREPSPRRTRRGLRAPDDQPPPYRPPWSWSNLPSRDRPSLLVLGELGAGKSTALGALARHYCSEGELVPLFIPLPRFANVVHNIGSGTSLIQYAEDRAEELAGEPFQRLDRERQFVWILDGLDEVLDPAARGHVLRSIELLRRGDGKPRFVVVGSRPQPDPQLSPDFIRHELAPWTEENIEKLVRRYHQAIRPGTEGERRSERLLRAFRTNPVLHELCQSPLLLALILSLGSDGPVPWPRPSLYRETLRRVLDDERGGKARHVSDPSNLSSDDKLAFLAYVAWDILEQQQLTIARERLVQLAAAWLNETFAAAAQAGAKALVDDLSQRGTVFVPGDQGHLEFALRAWCDYATALEIRRRYRDEELPAVFAAHWDDPLWTEPLLLTAGMLAERNPSAVVPSLHAVLRSRVTLEQWYLAQPIIFMIRALCYCPNLHRQPLAGLAQALTEFALKFDEDVGSSFSSALREAGPQWPAAEELRRCPLAPLALSVCDVESRLAVLLNHLPSTESYWDQRQMLAFARRLGGWTDDEVRQLLAVPFPEQPHLDPIWPKALRVHIAVALLETGPAPFALAVLESDLHAAAPELRIYAALALLSRGEVHTESLAALEVAVREELWPEYIPSPMRMFLADAAAKCRDRLPDATWERLRTALSSSSSQPLRFVTEVGPRRAPAPEQSFDPSENHLRRLLDLPADAPLSPDTVPALLSRARPEMAALALDAVATEGFLPADVWRPLGTKLLAQCEAFYADRPDWRGHPVDWHTCDIRVTTVFDLATLLGDRDALQRIADDHRIEEFTRNSARRRLERGKHLDVLLKRLSDDLTHPR